MNIGYFLGITYVSTEHAEHRFFLQLGICVLRYRARVGVAGQNKVVLKYLNLNSKLEFLTSFPGRLMNYQTF